MAKKQGTGTLIAAAKAIKPRNRTWISEVTAEQREEIYTVCRGIVSGQINGSIRSIAEAWAKMGIPCSRNKLTELVSQFRSGAMK